MKLKTLFIFFVIAMFFAASGLNAEETKKPEARPEQAAEETKKPEAAPETEKPVTAAVTDTLNAGNYIYLKVDADGKEVWLATSPKILGVSVEKGDKVEYIGGVPMSNFKSRSLDRTFESILFISKIKVLNKERPALPSDEVHKNIGQAPKPATSPESGEIAKAEGGQTIADMYSKSEQLKDKEVTLKAKVTKINKNIKKKTWYKLEDGTGAAPDNSIFAVSTERAGLGDIVTVTGVLKINVALGAGYSYKVLIDDAKFSK